MVKWHLPCGRSIPRLPVLSVSLPKRFNMYLKLSFSTQLAFQFGTSTKFVYINKFEKDRKRLKSHNLKIILV
jgi:hypothetical protein